MKRATKNIRTVLTKIGPVTNGGQNPHVSTLNWIKGLLLSVYSSHFRLEHMPFAPKNRLQEGGRGVREKVRKRRVSEDGETLAATDDVD